jgi:hypothetical protein
VYARFAAKSGLWALQDVLNAQALQKRDGKLAAIVVFHWKSNARIAGKLLFWIITVSIVRASLLLQALNKKFDIKIKKIK